MSTPSSSLPRPSALRPLLALAAAFFLLAPSARAAEATQEAKDRFQRGQTHYALGEFTEAVAEFREAYRLSNAPAILFNLGQAMRQLGNYKQAYFYYSQYLSRRADAPNRAEVEQFMETMKKKIDADEDAERMRAQADAARPAPPHYPEDRLEAEENGAVRPAAKEQAKAAAKPAAPASKAAPAAAKTPPVGTKAGEAKAPEPKLAAAAPLPRSTSAAPAPGRSEAESALVPPEAPREALAVPPPREGGVKATRVAGYAVLGAGVAAGALAFVFHRGAQSAADELNQKYQAGTLLPADAHLKADVDSKGKLATLSAVGAGVLVLSGALLAFAF